ncbi:hypothetical protein VNO80_24755 [Phaseolus coccineus]|uniref:Epidermal patterning factor-like protein n=1 Tax=Phaseolus coccineus TaxID=3886 RepID=A0AAN9LU26_PHACN
MFTTLKQTHLCRNVFFLFLLCTLIFSSSAASSKDSESGESLKSSTGGAMSRPPNCISRCEKCTPCKPILVATPPAAAPHQTDSASRRPHGYYPLVWKCTSQSGTVSLLWSNPVLLFYELCFSPMRNSLQRSESSSMF